MHYEKFVSFLEKHNIYDEKLLEYYKTNSTYVDYKDENGRVFIGCYPKLENDVLTEVKICVPKIEDGISTSINIHEYVHLLMLSKMFNQRYIETGYEEVLPILYELVFMTENINNLSDYYKYYGDYLIKNNYEDYNLAMELFKKVIKNSENLDIKNLDLELKKTTRK